MARIRTIKPDFFTSESVASLPYESRLTFIGLWTYADDEFRCVDNPKLIRAAIWPLDDRTLGDIEKDIDELAAAGMVVRYSVDGRNYLHIPGMAAHQRINRPTPSKLPPPPTNGNAVKPHGALTEHSRSTHPRLTHDSPPERKGTEQGTGKGVTPPRARADEAPPEDEFPPEPHDEEPDDIVRVPVDTGGPIRWNKPALELPPLLAQARRESEGQ
jgi:hypothetical protein